jgi:hypothetical protein
MNSKIALAVMEKARRVFEREDTFLSFPLNPVPFTKNQLDSIANGDLTSSALMDFSLQVNLIPSGMIWPPSVFMEYLPRTKSCKTCHLKSFDPGGS